MVRSFCERVVEVILTEGLGGLLELHGHVVLYFVTKQSNLFEKNLPSRRMKQDTTLS